jgi:hypothetical protein
MKNLAPAFLLTVSLLSPAPSPRAAESPRPTGGAQPDAPEVYPWSETSPTVRVPKSFLGFLNVRSVEITNHHTQEFTLASDFIDVFRVTAKEAEEVNRNLKEALHEYRTERAKHFTPIEDAAVPQPPGLPPNAPPEPKPRERVSFRLEPFPEQADAIYRKLEARLPAILGKQRVEQFWLNARPMFRGEMKRFGRQTDRVEEEITTWSFELVDKEPLNVELYTTYLAGEVVGFERGPFSEAFDRYVPQTVKPILARWRETVADSRARHPADQTPPPGPVISAGEAREDAEEAPPRSMAARTATRTASEKWGEQAAFIDLPKSRIPSLQIVGLTDDEQISEEAATLLGMTRENLQAVQQLYGQMRQRMEQLEIDHFKRVRPGENNFVLQAFPKKAAELRAEWRRKLGETLGAGRATTLVKLLRTPMMPEHIKRREGRGRRGGFPLRYKIGPAAPWFERGVDEINARIETAPDNGGKIKLSVEWRSKKGAQGTFGGTTSPLPSGWLHLLTPDVLGLHVLGQDAQKLAPGPL